MKNLKNRLRNGYKICSGECYNVSELFIVITPPIAPTTLPPRLIGNEVLADIRICESEIQTDSELKSLVDQLNARDFVVIGWPDGVRAAVIDIKPLTPSWLARIAYEQARDALEFVSTLSRIPTEFSEKRQT